MFRQVSIAFRSRFVQFIALALTVMFWTVSCAPQTSNNANNAAAQPLAVSTNTWIGYSGHNVAMKKGFYKEAGLNIQDTMFPSNAEQLTAFLAGRTDVAWLTSADSIQMAAKDPSIRIIFLIDYSNGSDGILGRNISSPTDLRGKTLARENILFERVLLRAYLDKAGLTENDLKIRDLLAPDAANAFAAKQVDAAVTYEHFLILCAYFWV
jgi:NitT/TauT family transport system substrate-binding protein